MTCTGAAICLPVLILYNVVPKICFFKDYTALRSFKYTFIYLFVQFDLESPSYNVKFLFETKLAERHYNDFIG